MKKRRIEVCNDDDIEEVICYERRRWDTKIKKKYATHFHKKMRGTIYTH